MKKDDQNLYEARLIRDGPSNKIVVYLFYKITCIINVGPKQCMHVKYALNGAQTGSMKKVCTATKAADMRSCTAHLATLQ